ncbi:MAG: flagellar export chaperone FlgN [Phycisphaerae bacterium]
MMTTSGDRTVEAVNSPEDVLGLLREQASLYVKLETLAVRQQSLVTAEDAGPLLMLLADRQKLLERLAGLATRLEPVRRRWAAYRERLSNPQRAEADRLWEEVRRRLRRIIESDEQDARVLSARKQSVAKALCTTHSTSQAISAYRAPAGRTPRLDYVDEGSR